MTPTVEVYASDFFRLYKVKSKTKFLMCAIDILLELPSTDKKNQIYIELR